VGAKIRGVLGRLRFSTGNWFRSLDWRLAGAEIGVSVVFWQGVSSPLLTGIKVVLR
jgi:hypothetical protein